MAESGWVPNGRLNIPPERPNRDISRPGWEPCAYVA
jgi:hypothetical protein